MTDAEIVEFFTERATRRTPRRLPVLATPVQEETLPRSRRGGNRYRYVHTGHRPDLEENCRSNWEANLLRILKSYRIPYQYEPYIFTFPVKRGTKAYIPDVYLDCGDYIEVKGYFDTASRIKIKRFKKYYPEEWARFTMVINKTSTPAKETCDALAVPRVLYYQDLSRLFRDQISNWEGA